MYITDLLISKGVLFRVLPYTSVLKFRHIYSRKKLCCSFQWPPENFEIAPLQFSSNNGQLLYVFWQLLKFGQSLSIFHHHKTFPKNITNLYLNASKPKMDLEQDKAGEILAHIQLLKSQLTAVIKLYNTFFFLFTSMESLTPSPIISVWLKSPDMINFTALRILINSQILLSEANVSLIARMLKQKSVNCTTGRCNF